MSSDKQLEETWAAYMRRTEEAERNFKAAESQWKRFKRQLNVTHWEHDCTIQPGVGVHAGFSPNKTALNSKAPSRPYVRIPRESGPQNTSSHYIQGVCFLHRCAWFNGYWLCKKVVTLGVCEHNECRTKCFGNG